MSNMLKLGTGHNWILQVFLNKLDGIQSLPSCCFAIHSPDLSHRKAIARVDWVVATARSLREKEHKHLATSIAQGG